MAYRSHAEVTSADIAGAVVSRLRAAGSTVAVAESLTGGLLGASIVAVPGASRVFRGGAMTYAMDTKSAVLGVDVAWLAAHGSVDAQVALMMADGARCLFDADLALATTGVAGPGSAEGHAAGTVFVACTGYACPPQVRRVHLAGDRREVRATVTDLALALLLP